MLVQSLFDNCNSLKSEILTVGSCTTMVSVHTDPLTLSRTVLLQTGWTVLVLQTLSAHVIPGVA